MNATINAAVSPTAVSANHVFKKHGHGHLVAVTGTVVLVGTIVAIVSAQSTSTAPITSESLFAEAIRPNPTRLNSARKAAKCGDRELAIHDYLASIQEDTSTAKLAITELVKVFLAGARSHRAGGRYADESAQINRCYQTLLQLKHMDASTKTFAEPARVTLFKEMAHVRAVGNERAKQHIMAADELRRRAKGKHWWNDDDESKQADALHKVNLAWSYYPGFTDEWMVSKMYEIWADMKDELPDWQYTQIMEQDRLQLGRVIGDRS